MALVEILGYIAIMISVGVRNLFFARKPMGAFVPFYGIFDSLLSMFNFIFDF